MKKKLLSVILSVITAITMSAVPIYAVELDGSESDVVEKVEAEESVGTGDTAIDTGETNTIEIKSDDLNSSSEWKEQINKIGKDILIQLNTKPIDEYEKVIAKASTENKREIEKIYGEVISDVVIEKVKIDLDEDNTVPDTGVPSVVLDEKAYKQLTSTFVISDAAVFEISPLYFSLEIVRSDLDRDISSEKYLNTAEKASTKNQQMGIRQKYITVKERRLPRQK